MEKNRFNELKEKSFGKFNELKEKGSEKFRTIKKEPEEPDYQQDDSYLNSPSMKYFDEPEGYEPTRLNVPDEELYALEDPYGTEYRRQQPAQPPKKVRKKRRKKHPLLKTLIVVAIAAALFLHLSSDMFDVKTIELTGNDTFSKKQIIEMTDFKVGKNIFISRLGKSTDSIMENPYFEKVSIRRDLPNGITIEVKERKAVGAISRDGSSSNYVIIDGKGVVLEDKAKNRKDRNKKKLTQLKGLKIKEAVLGEKLQVTDNEKKDEALKLLKGISASGMKISKVKIGENDVKLYINDEFYVKGKYKSVMPITEDGRLKQVIKNLKDSGYSRGTIMVGNNEYVAFSKKLK